MENGDNSERESGTSPKTEKLIRSFRLDPLIEQARNIVKQIRSGELVLTPEARTIKITKETGKDAFGRTRKEFYSLSSLIANEVTNFVKADTIRTSKAQAPHLEDYERTMLSSKKFVRLHEIACNLIEYIEYARANGVIKNVEVENLQKEVEQLRERLDIYEKENLQLKEENKNLHTLVENLGGKLTTDLEKGDEDE